MRAFYLPMIALIALAGCSVGYDDREPDAPSEEEEDADAPRIEGDPTERPVRIGEGGPRFDACQAVGRVTGRATLDVLASPFDAARKKDSIGEGQNVWICTRSHDQQWFGVVYDRAVPAGKAEDATLPKMGPGDCGVSSPVRTKRDYDGPCNSGWIESNFVKLIAG